MSCFKCLNDKVPGCPRSCGSEWTGRFVSPSCPTKVTRTALSVTDIDHHVNKTLSTRARHAFGPRAVPLISSTIASTSKSGIRLQLASSSQLRSRPAMLASRCQTLRARIPRTRSEPTGCAAPSARREGSTAATACYRHHSDGFRQLRQTPNPACQVASVPSWAGPSLQTQGP